MLGELGERKLVRVLTWNVNGLRACLRRLNTTLSELLDSLSAGTMVAHGAIAMQDCQWRPLLAPRPQHDSCAAFCADVVCIQETKLRRTELDRDLALVNGWCVPCHVRVQPLSISWLGYLTLRDADALMSRESFFAHCTTKRGSYSGTATFCRSAVTVPVAAEAGLSGTVFAPSPDSGGAAAGCETLREGCVVQQHGCHRRRMGTNPVRSLRPATLAASSHSMVKSYGFALTDA